MLYYCLGGIIMSRIVRCLLISILLTTILSLIQRIKQDFLKKLSFILYEEKNPDHYLEELNSFSGKLFMSNRDRLILSIDALMLKKEYQEVSDIFELLEKLKLSELHQLALYQKKIAYYLEIKNNIKAIESFNQLKQLSQNNRQRAIQLVVEENDILIHVYAKKDGYYAQSLENKAKTIRDHHAKGICLYRSAVSYYNLKDFDKCKSLLEEAAFYLKDTIYEKTIQQVLNGDLDLMYEKIM